MFAPSVTTVSAAIFEIADTVGASADDDQRNRALRSLAASYKFLNGRYNWPWLLTEGTPISVVAPFSVTLAASAGQSSATAAAGHGVKVDDFMVGSGFSLGARVSATATTAMGFTLPITGFSAGVITATITANRDFYDFPTNWKQPYTVRLLRTRSTLYPVQRRAYDRGVDDEFQVSTPQWYDLFAGWDKGKVRLLPAPAAADTLMLRYYRRMSVPTTTATAAVLDLPQDYDLNLIAWAKWHFLTDKGDGRSQQAQTWMSLAQEGLKVMIADSTKQPDETLGFYRQPAYGTWNLNSTSGIDWNYT